MSQIPTDKEVTAYVGMHAEKKVTESLPTVALSSVTVDSLARDNINGARLDGDADLRTLK